MFYFFLGVMLLIAATALKVVAKVPEELQRSKKFVNAGVAGLGVILILSGVVSTSVFYAEPGYTYHVRTMTGKEEVVTETGYKFYPLGRWNAWKKAITVQAVAGGGNTVDAESDTSNTSASAPPLNIMFLDQVDADAEATTRFSLPSDTETFLKMAREYRSPENLIRTALIPAFKETLQSTASLMTAEYYYSGGRSEFNNDFQTQMESGIYLVKREEISSDLRANRKSSANASKDQQDEYEDNTKTEFVVTKVLNETGQPVRKTQNFKNYGISVIDSRITDMKPNRKFVDRMTLKQKASADRAIAREQRIQEEEQRLLAIAKGEREVAQRQAAAKVVQIEKTTNAETDKQLALTEATKLKEQAQIEKETAEVQYAKAQIDAKKIKTLADAEAYQKKVILNADNALAQKLDAEIEIQKLWANAFAQRKVPTTVFGSGGSTPTGADSETKAFMQMLTVDAAKRLNYDRTLDTK